jgi:hypothetical protein
MPRGDKVKYTDKQVRKADHIAESYESRGVPEGRTQGVGNGKQGKRRRKEKRFWPRPSGIARFIA